MGVRKALARRRGRWFLCRGAEQLCWACPCPCSTAPVPPQTLGHAGSGGEEDGSETFSKLGKATFFFFFLEVVKSTHLFCTEH